MAFLLLHVFPLIPFWSTVFPTIQEGDIVSVDIGACYQGYHGDSAWTYGVGTISDADQKLLDVTRGALFEGLRYAKAGNRLTDISHAIGEFVFAHGY